MEQLFDEPSPRECEAAAPAFRRLIASDAGWILGALLTFASLDCTGAIRDIPNAAGAAASGGPASSGPSTTMPDTTATCDAAGPSSVQGLTSRRLRRLSRREYANVIGDLLGVTAQQAALAALPEEPTVGGFDNQDAALFVSPSLQEELADLAAQLASDADPATLAPCATAGASAACLQTFIQAFALKAYGRPLSDSELAAANTLAATGQDYATQVRLVVEMMLQSPYTIYASELGPDGAAPSAQPVPLTPYEKASQLSLLLTGRRPDAPLLAAAQSTGLARVTDIQQQVQRLLPMAQGQAQLSLFINGWLAIGPMSEVPKSPQIYPEFTMDLAAAMQQEFDQFVTTQLNGGNGTLASFMTATSSSVPGALKPIYGADLLPSGPDPKHRSGILSLPAVLAYNSSDISSGPIQRGLLVRRQLLCQNVPPPPANVLLQIATMPVDRIDSTTTTRQKFEDHLTQPSCAACHAAFDPIGFGLEDMDGLGRFRIAENGLPVDSSGALTGTDVDGAFEGPANLATKLSHSQDLASCMVSHFFNFAQARDPDSSDQCVLRAWTAKFAQGGGRINALVYAYVTDKNFAFRKDDR
jgi:hypothetical protein